jgi:hypothetical protein
VGKGWSKVLRRAGVELSAFVELDPRKIGQQIHGAPVVDTESGAAMGGVLHLAAVGQEGARRRICGALEAAGKRVMEDFVAVA